MTMKRIIPLIIILLFSCQKEELVDVSNKAALEKVIESSFKQYQMPGLAYLAVKNDSVVISEAMGFANVKDKIPFTPQTRMIIASISKTIVATYVGATCGETRNILTNLKVR
jgi:CubicO group peptidase (beta-lactamase class C family)